jgi:hypothetical protein
MKTAPAQNIAIAASLIFRRDLKITAATAKPTIEPSKNSAPMMIDAKPAVADIVCLPSTASADKINSVLLTGIPSAGLEGRMSSHAPLIAVTWPESLDSSPKA